MVLEVLGRIAQLLLLRPEASIAEALLIAGVGLVVLAAATVVAVALRVPDGEWSAEPFDAVRVLLRADDPTAPGHRMARAPGGIR